MKKRIISVIAVIAAAASVSASAAFADASEVSEIETGGIVMQTEPAYVYFDGTVISAAEGEVVATVGGEEVYFMTDASTLVYSCEGEKLTELAEGDEIVVYVDANAPAPAIIPAQYSASVIIKNVENGMFVDVDKYTKRDDRYVNKAGTLSFESDEDYDGKRLLVFYTNSSRSIPALTDPEKIEVISSAADEDIEEKTVDFSEYDGISPKSTEDDILVPIRPIAETLGAEVEWNGDKRLITMTLGGTVIEMTVGDVNITVDNDMVVKAESAPVIYDGYTYVPINIISKIFGTDALWNADSAQLTLK